MWLKIIMNLQQMRVIEKPEAYIQRALRESRKGKKIRIKDKNKRQKAEYLQKIRIYKETIYTDLQKIIKGFPSFNNLNIFYKELIDSQINLDTLKKEISKLSWVRQKLIKLFKDYNNRIKIINSLVKIKTLQKEFYGRTSSLLKKSKKTFEFLEKSRKKMKNFPSIKTKIKTICISGFPNVGKSTLLKKLTGSKVEIKSYAFTTKKLLLGYINKKLQIIDTPGTLNRYDKMNSIEKQAHLAVKYLAEKIIYVFDLTETCGYEIEKQIELFKKFKEEFKEKEIIVFLSKTDLLKQEQIEIFSNYLKNQKVFCDINILKEYITP